MQMCTQKQQSDNIMSAGIKRKQNPEFSVPVNIFNSQTPTFNSV